MRIFPLFGARKRQPRAVGRLSALPPALQAPRLDILASAVLSAMDLSGQSLIDDIVASWGPHDVELKLLGDSVRVCQDLRIGVESGSGGKIKLRPIEIDTPEDGGQSQKEPQL